MLVTFRIIDTQTRLHSKPEIILARELAALVTLLRNERILPDVDTGEDTALPYQFEFNANSFATAKLARLFDYRGPIIDIIEEGQFLGRTLRVERVPDSSDIQLRVSEHIALATGFTLRADTAAKVFAAVGIDPANRTSISLDRLRSIMQQPTAAKAFEDLQITTVQRTMAMTVDTDCGEQIPRLEWQDEPA
jgi:hypothetical protein